MTGAPPAEAGPVRGRRRAARIAALGGSSVLLAAAAHTLGGGALPPWWLLLGLSAFVGTIAVALTARRLRLGVLVTVLLLEQIGLHLAFAVGGAAGCAGVDAAGTGHLTGAMTGMTAGMTAGTTMTTCPGDPTGASVLTGMAVPMGPMLLAHLAATLLTAWLLARGETLIWRTAGSIVDAIVAGAHARPTRRRRRPVDHSLPAPVPGPTAPAGGGVGSRAPPRPLTTAG